MGGSAFGKQIRPVSSGEQMRRPEADIQVGEGAGGRSPLCPLLPRGEGTLAARPRKFRLSAGLVPGLFYGLYLLTVMGTQGLAWAADIALPAVLVAGADAVQTLEQKAQLLLAQADAYRELSSFLAHDDANA